MFAVSSTSRSTTVKPAAGYADRAAIRRQAAVSRLNALAASAEATADQALCVPDSFDLVSSDSVVAANTDERQTLQRLGGPATVRLVSVQLESLRDDLFSLAPAQMDGRTSYDPVYDRVVLGYADAKLPAEVSDSLEETHELSAADIASVFHSVLGKNSADSRNATRKSQRRVSLPSPRFQVDTVMPTL
jgi:hypothetical protein